MDSAGGEVDFLGGEDEGGEEVDEDDDGEDGEGDEEEGAAKALGQAWRGFRVVEGHDRFSLTLGINGFE